MEKFEETLRAVKEKESETQRLKEIFENVNKRQITKNLAKNWKNSENS